MPPDTLADSVNTRRPEFPKRYTDLNLEAIRRQYGSRADKVARYYFKGDEPADKLVAAFTAFADGRGSRMLEQALALGIDKVNRPPRELRELFAELEDPPLWLDQRLLEIGSRAQLRCGVLIGLVLASSCLPLTYRSGAGVKPLVATGEFDRKSIRRMSETNRYFIECCRPKGMLRYGEGWKLTIRIRMMHAQLRRLIPQKPNFFRGQPWNEAAWGIPINQADMAGTLLMFSGKALDHLRRIGFQFSSEESEGVMHLWRYIGHLGGLVPELLCATENEGRQLLTLLLDITGRPDDDSVKLARTLMETAIPLLVGGLFPLMVPFIPVPEKRPGHAGRAGFVAGLTKRLGLRIPPELVRRELGQFCYGLSRGIIGPAAATDLGFPPTHWSCAAPLLRSTIAPLEVCRRLIPGATRLTTWLGQHQIERLMNAKLFAKPVRH